MQSESATYGIDLHALFDKYNKSYNDLSEKSRMDLYEFEHKNNFDDFDGLSGL